jgi:hypothetical protein
VVDPSRAVIPGVTVIVSNPETGLRQVVSTNSEGFFSSSDLSPGSYEVEVHQSGSGPFIESGLRVETGQVLTLNLKLELGQQATALTVTESSLHVETTNTALGDTITTAKISSIPLNGRGFTDLLALQAGVVPASSRQPNAVVMSGCTSTSPSGDLNPGNLSISGQRETSNGFVLNGSNVQEDFNMGAAVIPNLDSIEDFRVLTGNFNAQYGIYSGGKWWSQPKRARNWTINYGLRWDMLPPWRELYNQLQSIVWHEKSRVYPGAPRGLAFPGDSGIPSTLAPTHSSDFAPRLGVAYSPAVANGWLGRLPGRSGASSARRFRTFLHRL